MKNAGRKGRRLGAYPTARRAEDMKIMPERPLSNPRKGAKRPTERELDEIYALMMVGSFDLADLKRRYIRWTFLQRLHAWRWFRSVHLRASDNIFIRRVLEPEHVKRVKRKAPGGGLW